MRDEVVEIEWVSPSFVVVDEDVACVVVVAGLPLEFGRGGRGVATTVAVVAERDE